MNITSYKHCIICLEKDVIKNTDNGLVSLPCHCIAYVHPECFKKLNTNNCIICKQPNQYSDETFPLEQLSINLPDIQINQLVELDDEEIQFTFYEKLMYFFNASNLPEYRREIIFYNYMQSNYGCLCLNLILVFILNIIYFIIVLVLFYLSGLLLSLICSLALGYELQASFNGYSIFLNIILGLICSLCFVTCCYNNDDE